ncbi:WhiB family transcriptional regulator [Rhodococcus sp. WS4]|nr:WhiB family transcriptional regulator [Rhodococcus sp. WS4]
MQHAGATRGHSDHRCCTVQSGPEPTAATRRQLHCPSAGFYQGGTSEVTTNGTPRPHRQPQSADLPERGNWRLRAASRGAASMFFSPDSERGTARAQRERRAKLTCKNCPVLTDCREYVLAVAGSYGKWGGLSESDRTRARRGAQRARTTRRLVHSGTTGEQ